MNPSNSPLPQPPSQVLSRPQPQNQPQDQPQAHPKLQPKPSLQPQSQAQPKLQTKPQPQTQSQTQPQPQPKPQTVTQSQPPSQTQPQALPQPQSQSQSQTQTKRQPQTQAQPQAQVQPQSQSNPPSQQQPQPKPLSQSSSQPPPQPTSQTQARGQPQPQPRSSSSINGQSITTSRSNATGQAIKNVLSNTANSANTAKQPLTAVQAVKNVTVNTANPANINKDPTATGQAIKNVNANTANSSNVNKQPPTIVQPSVPQQSNPNQTQSGANRESAPKPRKSKGLLDSIAEKPKKKVSAGARKVTENGKFIPRDGSISSVGTKSVSTSGSKMNDNGPKINNDNKDKQTKKRPKTISKSTGDNIGNDNGKSTNGGSNRSSSAVSKPNGQSANSGQNKSSPTVPLSNDQSFSSSIPQRSTVNKNIPPSQSVPTSVPTSSQNPSSSTENNLRNGAAQSLGKDPNISSSNIVQQNGDSNKGLNKSNSAVSQATSGPSVAASLQKAALMKSMANSLLSNPPPAGSSATNPSPPLPKLQTVASPSPSSLDNSSSKTGSSTPNRKGVSYSSTMRKAASPRNMTSPDHTRTPPTATSSRSSATSAPGPSLNKSPSSQLAASTSPSAFRKASSTSTSPTTAALTSIAAPTVTPTTTPAVNTSDGFNTYSTHTSASFHPSSSSSIDRPDNTQPQSTTSTTQSPKNKSSKTNVRKRRSNTTSSVGEPAKRFKPSTQSKNARSAPRMMTEIIDLTTIDTSDEEDDAEPPERLLEVKEEPTSPGRELPREQMDTNLILSPDDIWRIARNRKDQFWTTFEEKVLSTGTSEAKEYVGSPEWLKRLSDLRSDHARSQRRSSWKHRFVHKSDDRGKPFLLRNIRIGVSKLAERKFPYLKYGRSETSSGISNTGNFEKFWNDWSDRDMNLYTCREDRFMMIKFGGFSPHAKTPGDSLPTSVRIQVLRRNDSTEPIFRMDMSLRDDLSIRPSDMKIPIAYYIVPKNQKNSLSYISKFKIVADFTGSSGVWGEHFESDWSRLHVLPNNDFDPRPENFVLRSTSGFSLDLCPPPTWAFDPAQVLRPLPQKLIQIPLNVLSINFQDENCDNEPISGLSSTDINNFQAEEEVATYLGLIHKGDFNVKVNRTKVLGKTIVNIDLRSIGANARQDDDTTMEDAYSYDDPFRIQLNVAGSEKSESMEPPSPEPAHAELVISPTTSTRPIQSVSTTQEVQVDEATNTITTEHESTFVVPIQPRQASLAPSLASSEAGFEFVSATLVPTNDFEIMSVTQQTNETTIPNTMEENARTTQRKDDTRNNQSIDTTPIVRTDTTSQRDTSIPPPTFNLGADLQDDLIPLQDNIAIEEVNQVMKSKLTMSIPEVTVKKENLDGMISTSHIYRPTATGLAGPIMVNRQNVYTNWSTRIDPGTLADLFPLLDKIWDGGNMRHVIRDHEESVIWTRYHLTEKQRFMAVCWNRWVYEMGPIPASNRLEYYTSFMKVYGNILNQAELTREVGDMLHVFWRDNYCSIREMGETLFIWNEISGFQLKLTRARLEKEAREKEKERVDQELSISTQQVEQVV